MNQYWRAKNFLRNNQVALVSAGPLGLIFNVGPTPQIVAKRIKGYSCTCTHSSLKNDEKCSHIKAVKWWFEGKDLEDENCG